ncbi:hypothetical protein [Sinorhizobium fredii]|uniref:hypothetical protein n=1 Tax=Rhizobium fredii TaxID=380 RepID=UPI00138B0B49|nr:hypothetical protein [Sinorhizobium fredii]
MTAWSRDNNFQFAPTKRTAVPGAPPQRGDLLKYAVGISAGGVFLYTWWDWMDSITPLDKSYTTDEAAERLRVTRRTMIKLGRDLGSCSKMGREDFFSERDLLDIWQAQRAMPTSSQGRAVSTARRRLAISSEFRFHRPRQRRVEKAMSYLEEDVERAIQLFMAEYAMTRFVVLSGTGLYATAILMRPNLTRARWLRGTRK